jgi:hypothetical protein
LVFDTSYTFKVKVVCTNTLLDSVFGTSEAVTAPSDTEVPVIHLPEGFYGEISISCFGDVPLVPDVTATDNCVSPSLAFSSVSDYVPGTCSQNQKITRIWTFSDVSGGHSSVTQIIYVDDNSPPVIPSGQIPSATLQFHCGSEVPAGVSITAIDNCDGEVTLSPSDQTIPVENGCANRYDINRAWNGADCAGNPVSVHQTIHVDDQTGPVAAPATDACLWPVNHKYVPFDLSTFVTGTDNCGGMVSAVFERCNSTEPENGLGDGNTFQDCVFVPGSHTIYVRAERRGVSPLGRYYTVGVSLVDGCGNSQAASRRIFVPHNQMQTIGKTCTRATIQEIPH